MKLFQDVNYYFVNSIDINLPSILNWCKEYKK